MANGYEQAMIESSKQSLANATDPDPVEVLQLKCLAKGTSGITQLGRLFRKMDIDKNNQLSLEEFTKGLQELGLINNNEEASKLFNIFDIDKSGTIGLEEFLSRMVPPMSSDREALVRKVFEKLDTSGDGEVTLSDFDEQDKFSGKDFDKFVKEFDDPENPDGKISWKEFYDYYSSVSKSIEDDKSFNDTLKQAWKLD